MKPSLAATSLVLFVISVLLLILLTLFESSISGMSMTVERTLSAVLLVLPAIAGIVLGILSFRRTEAQRWMAISGVILNALFALFHVIVLAFAG